MKELGIYVHFPFCVKKCAYCDFLSGPAGAGTIRRYVQALQEEMALLAAQYGRLSVSSIFLGGGTPSILPVEWTAEVLEALRQFFQVQEDAEITIECNPGTVDKEKLKQYRQAGINRISYGLQSVHEQELQMLGRIHSMEQFVKCYQDARAAGFSNVNVDLMSALPGQTLTDWMDTLKQVTELQPPPEHISAYSLIIEPGTLFYEQYTGHDELLPDENTEREMYRWTARFLQEKGYRRYEISNYAKEGYESKHNNYYWTGVDYLGLGIGAASYLQGVRSKNTENLQFYIQNLELTGTTLADIRMEEHVLSEREQQEEYLFLGLRRMEGISTTAFAARFHVSYDTVYGQVTRRLLELGLLQQQGEWISLTDRGIDVSNVVLAEFLQEE